MRRIPHTFIFADPPITHVVMLMLDTVCSYCLLCVSDFLCSLDFSSLSLRPSRTRLLSFFGFSEFIQTAFISRCISSHKYVEPLTPPVFRRNFCDPNVFFFTYCRFARVKNSISCCCPIPTSIARILPDSFRSPAVYTLPSMPVHDPFFLTIVT